MTAHRAGAPRYTGRLERPKAPFLLDPSLAQAGDLPVRKAVEAVVADWRRQVAEGKVSSETIATHTRVLNTFSKYMPARGAETLNAVTHDLVWEWIQSPRSGTSTPVTVNMVALRREVAKAFYLACYSLGITDDNPAAVFPRVRRPERFVHPLTDAQVARLKVAANYEVTLQKGFTRSYEPGSLKSPTALALVLLGAQPGEVGYIRCADVDLLTGLVWASGGGERYRPRWLPIDDTWVFDVLLTRVAWLATKFPDDYLDRTIAYESRPGSADNFARRAASTSGTLDKILVKASLKDVEGVRVASISEWLANKVFRDTRRVEAVAARLGLSSLDTAAHLVSYEWPQLFEISGPGTGGGAQ